MPRMTPDTLKPAPVSATEDPGHLFKVKTPGGNLVILTQAELLSYLHAKATQKTQPTPQTLRQKFPSNILP